MTKADLRQKIPLNFSLTATTTDDRQTDM